MHRVTKFALPAVGLALVGVACSDYEIQDNDKPPSQLDNLPDPCIEVRPEVVDFSEIQVMVDLPQTETVEVHNACEGDLEIYELELDDPMAPFDLGAIDTVLVPEGQSTTFTVTFDPDTSGTWSSKALIGSNDPETPTAEVTLNGTGVAPIIDVDPDSHDFGSPYIGCELEQPYTVSNVGTAELLVDDFQFATASRDFGFDADPSSNGSLPLSIAPTDSVEVFIDYQGLDQFADQAYLTVNSNDPYTPEVLVTATASSTLFGKNLDVYEQAVKPSTDIIFTMDRSGSMSDNNAQVVANFDTFLTTLVGLDADYHVAVVVEDSGCVIGTPYIDQTFSASAAFSAFETMAAVGGSSGYPFTEAGFTIAETALQSSLISPGGCNYGLYREDATLSLVHVSDEPEQSLNPWGFYVALFQSMKADPDDVIINAVAGDYPGGCSGADAGTGYYEATVATGGLFLSICATDWGSHLESLAEGSITIKKSFVLSQLPVPETIVVMVDGYETTTGWEYDQVNQAVVFERDHIPAGGSTIEIEYHVMPDCES